jgi:hypothetical protein
MLRLLAETGLSVRSIHLRITSTAKCRAITSGPKRGNWSDGKLVLPPPGTKRPNTTAGPATHESKLGACTAPPTYAICSPMQDGTPMVSSWLEAFPFDHGSMRIGTLLKLSVGNERVFEDGERTERVITAPTERCDYRARHPTFEASREPHRLPTATNSGPRARLCVLESEITLKFVVLRQRGTTPMTNP